MSKIYFFELCRQPTSESHRPSSSSSSKVYRGGGVWPEAELAKLTKIFCLPSIFTGNHKVRNLARFSTTVAFDTLWFRN